MEEICFDTINNIVMNLSTTAVASTIAANNSSELENAVNSNEKYDQLQQHSMPLDRNPASTEESEHQMVMHAVLDDENSNSGILEIFDQSSNPSAAASEINSGIVSIKPNHFRDDSADGSSSESSAGISRTSFEVNSVEPDNVSAEEKIEKEHTISSDLFQNQMHGVIVSSGGTTIYLETPVVDEQQHHIHHHPQIIINNSNEFIENTTKPKRLSDEFLLVENGLGMSDDVQNVENNASQDRTVGMINKAKSSLPANDEDILETDLQHDKMSFRLKKMNINNTVTENSASIMDDAPSSSYTIYPQDMEDIQTIDLIEKRDFENEKRITGGIILKSSSLINKNKLNLKLIQTCTKQPQKQNVFQDKDDCPSSSSNSSGRAVSSDSKCAYKDLATTPTSSRAYNSRLTKSTAKINLCSTLSHPQQKLPHMKQKIVLASSSNTPKLQFNQALSSVIVEAPASSNATRSAPATVDLYSNSNSNDSMTSERCFTNVNKLNNATTTTTATTKNSNDSVKTCQPLKQQEEAGEPLDSGCSRTNAIKTEDVDSLNIVDEVIDDDAQPSTSSARCQYAPVLKNMRQVHASAQTNEKYLSRAASCSTSTSVLSGVNLAANRLRRKELTSHLNNNSTSEEVYAAFKEVVAEVAAAAITKDREEFNDDPWADCEENSDFEEICTCHHSATGSSHGGSNSSLNETEDLEFLAGVKDSDLSNFIQMVSISEDGTSHSHIVSSPDCTSLLSNQHQRKRKYNDSRLLDGEYSAAVGNSGGDVNSRKRIAYDYSSTPRSSQSSNALILASVGSSTPSSSLVLTAGSPISRRTPRSIIPTRDNPPPELQDWLAQFQRWSHAERLLAVDRLIEHCEPTQVRHMMKVIEPQFQRDFISLLPRELALQVLAYLDPMDLLRAAQTCRSWRFLCDDNLLWKEKCRKSQILTELRSNRPKRGRAGNMPHIASPWKAAYMRQHIIEMNWRSRAIREPKVLKGHDDHVITCLQFSGNRIVSGSDDNTLKVWSAVTGRCLRTLVGHTGGVWSSQMSGNIIISGSTDRTLKVWDMETGQCVHTLLGHTSTVRCMHLHGKRVVSGSRDATLRVWDIEQGTCLHVLVGHLAAVRCVQYDGKLIVSGAYDYMVKIWHPERQECLHTLQGHTNRVYSLQFDGIHVVSGSLDTSIRVWDVETGNCKHTLMGHQSLTSGMELRQNILVSGNADSTVKVWDITTGQCLQTLSGPNKHQSAVTCLQFNSRFVVTSSDDGTVKLWDVKTGEFIRNLVALDSGGSGGVVWRIRANDTKLICAVGSRNGTEETKLMVLDFDVEGACVKCS